MSIASRAYGTAGNSLDGYFALVQDFPLRDLRSDSELDGVLS